ncbi:hypothetical protein L5515_009145 [Caenorhabditis briggsae]|uniref:Uncharacterized protein n=1 Tax=Caenorhabditis briggsae TaxID=6238 RepID=A0AAE9JNK6_CAEBR|nr:hypothetical protein L5515_009145 [Caenorhabditis briggsae]
MSRLRQFLTVVSKELLGIRDAETLNTSRRDDRSDKRSCLMSGTKQLRRNGEHDKSRIIELKDAQQPRRPRQSQKDLSFSNFDANSMRFRVRRDDSLG